MWGWWIIFGVFVLMCIGGTMWLFVDDYSEGWLIMVILGGLGTLIIFLVLSITPLQVKEEIRTFKNYQEMVEKVYQNEDITDVAMNLKIIEMNQWLAQARAKEETYGIFSFYSGKLDDLEYIIINMEENE